MSNKNKDRENGTNNPPATTEPPPSKTEQNDGSDEQNKLPEPKAVDAAADKIKPHERCPVCWGGCKGVGLVYTRNGNRRYYKCKKTLTDSPPCGHTWPVDVSQTFTLVKNRDVELRQR